MTVLESFDGPLEPGGDYDGLHLVDLDLTGQAAPGARFIDCVLERCRLDGVRLDGARLVSTRLVEVQATALDLKGAALQDVELVGSRIGALQLFDGRLDRVRVDGGKYDDVNLRAAKVRDLTLDGCVLGMLDLSGATVNGLGTHQVRTDRLDVGSASLRRVDLRGAELRGVDGLAGLRGATVSAQQLLELSPVMAAHLGLTVD